MMHAMRMHDTQAATAKKAGVEAHDNELEMMVKRAIAVLEDYKAQDVVLLPMAGKANFTDFLVVATGTSSKHVASMGQALREKMKSDLLGVEGLNEGEWVCADMGAVVVHVFTPEKRVLYNLEKLWSYTFLPVE